MTEKTERPSLEEAPRKACPHCEMILKAYSKRLGYTASDIEANMYKIRPHSAWYLTGSPKGGAKLANYTYHCKLCDNKFKIVERATTVKVIGE